MVNGRYCIRLWEPLDMGISAEITQLQGVISLLRRWWRLLEQKRRTGDVIKECLEPCPRFTVGSGKVSSGSRSNTACFFISLHLLLSNNYNSFHPTNPSCHNTRFKTQNKENQPILRPSEYVLYCLAYVIFTHHIVGPGNALVELEKIKLALPTIVPRRVFCHMNC